MLWGHLVGPVETGKSRSWKHMEKKKTVGRSLLCYPWDLNGIHQELRVLGDTRIQAGLNEPTRVYQIPAEGHHAEQLHLPLI